MANYAYVENNNPIEFYDNLPKSWRNISGFNTITDEQYLNDIGWYRILKNPENYNPDSQKLSGYSYSFENGMVIESPIIEDLPSDQIITIVKKREDFLNNLRRVRDKLLSESDWTQCLDLQEIRSQEWKDDWKNYRQALRDLPDAYKFTNQFDSIEFPKPPSVTTPTNATQE